MALVDRLNADPASPWHPGATAAAAADGRGGRSINAIDPAKDVDGFHISNVGLLATGQKAMVPCTPLGCLMLLRDLHGIAGREWRRW